MFDMGEMLKKAQQMQGEIKKVQGELAKQTFTTGVARGAVVVTVNGEMEILDVKIDPSIAPMNDSEKLASLVKAAVNEGMAKAKEFSAKKMNDAAGGFNIPGLSGLLGG